jgi:hypothetical protein
MHSRVDRRPSRRPDSDICGFRAGFLRTPFADSRAHGSFIWLPTTDPVAHGISGGKEYLDSDGWPMTNIDSRGVIDGGWRHTSHP